MADLIEDDMNAMLFLIGVLGELKSRDLIGGGWDLTPNGAAAFDQLRASGYAPSKEQRRSFLEHFAKFDGDDLESADLLVVAYIGGFLDSEGRP